MTLSIGSMFSGYGGLDLAVEHVFNATTAWHCEWEDAPSKILATHWPGVPNYRDVTNIDWHNMPPVDIITGGFPCQDVSLAGRRAGMTEGTRSNLWGAMRTAIEIIQPRYVVAENVRGLLSAKADSELEPCTGCMGDHGGDGEHVLRALGRVLGDLAELGFDAQWRGLRAADVGAPHQRFRVFILATRRDLVADASSRRSGRWSALTGAGQGGESDAAPFGPGHRHGGTGPVQRHMESEPAEGWSGAPVADAIHRWEQVLGRRAPAPTELTVKGKHRLNARFAEFMMGLPAGWVTDVDITRNEQLKAIGNGVVPQQAAAALDHMLATQEAA